MEMTYGAPSYPLRRWFLWLLLLNVLFIVCMKFYLQPLTSADIVKFELAKTPPVAESLVQEWKQAGKYDKALQAIYLDYLFIVLYTGGLIAGCLFLSGLTKHEILIRAGKGSSLLLGIAAICDVAENVAMTRSLHGAITTWNVTLAYDMAAAKFSIIILCLLFMLVCFIFWLGNKVIKL